jgi:hypothetical protein
MAVPNELICFPKCMRGRTSAANFFVKKYVIF